MSNLLITIIQPHLHWEDKQRNLNMLEQMIMALSKAEIVVLPEMFSTGFTMQPQKLAEPMEGETMQWMRKLAAQKRIILTGSLIIKEEEQYFNRLIWMLPTGEFGYYDKRHLFAFAGEHESFAAGKKKLITSAKKWKIQPMICYDLRFPVWIRQNENPYDLLIFVANWPAKRIHAWKTLLKARAIENQCYVVGVNRVGTDDNGIAYNGNSMIIDPLGKELFVSSEECVQTVELDKNYLMDCRQKYPFLEDADEFLLRI